MRITTSTFPIILLVLLSRLLLSCSTQEDPPDMTDPPVVIDDDDVVDDDDSAPVIPDCMTDPYEPNNSLSGSVPFPNLGNEVLHICQGDDDWFELTVPPSSHSDFTVFYDRADGRIAARLHDAEGVEISESSEGFGREIIILVSEEGGTHHLQLELLENYREETGINYVFEALTQEVEACTDDPHEPNDSPPESLPVDVLSGEALVVCRHEDDYWGLDLLEGETITASVSWDQTEGDIWLFLIGMDHRELAMDNSGGGSAEISWTADMDLSVVINVELAWDRGQTPGASYYLEWSHTQ